MRFFNTRRVVRPVSALAAAVAVSGCTTDILNVETPNVIAESALGGSLGATTLRNGSVMDFIVAYSGTQDGYVVSSGNLADEIQTTDTFADRYATDQRTAVEALGGALNTNYEGLQRARAGMTTSIVRWKAAKTASAATNDSLGEMYAIRAYSELAFGEGFCSGVPFSRVGDNGEFEYGQPLTNAQMFTTAAATADSALASATAANIRSLASIAKGRILLNQGQYAQAAAAVTGVATNYRYVLSHSIATPRQNNGIWAGTFVSGSRYTAGTLEGTNGLDYLVTPADPRVPWVPSARQGFDGTSLNLPTQQKYTSQAAPFTLADGIEARLIEAEARLGGATGGTQADRDAMVAILNTLRATGLSTAIAPLTSPTTHAAAVDMLFKERAYWLWLTGHRLGDMRRLITQYNRTAATVFPVGTMRYRSVQYGTRTSLMVPVRERNNPNFKGCAD
ncbi:MAG TPA: hypothetical protein DGD08_02110 [Gemmatimonas aurantiaca]|uniref:RagB/SusD domain-containing protein n=2 Tax=Gemmatimonas aurantiaca TaxID=173480 RepID=C1AAV3_GEMAT|nr:hypothetical protein [Gemmatimonas aurantiaca]BAH39359.1 hypothetical protein GAU_2317 [Gemmatimonas aurantiaca T-27]HCT55988.1 hypothetical protein [Gemmatimonas aurantiaca]